MLSRNDIAKLRRLIQRVDALESMIQSQAFNTHRGGPAYLVKAPEGGIPAMVGNTPGFASCDMVRLWSDDLPADKKLADLGTRQPVRNLGKEVLEGETAVAHRDGFGDLFILPRDYIRLAQAPSGGIPARVNQTPGSATCTQVIVAPLSGTGFSAGDLVKTDLTFTVLNWDLTKHAEDGDRIIQVSSHSDGAFLIGASCFNEEDPDEIKLYEPVEGPPDEEEGGPDEEEEEPPL